MRKEDIRTLIKTQGMRSVVATFGNILEGVAIENGSKIHMKPSEMSIRGLWEGFVGDAEDTLPSYRDELLSEEVNSTGFNMVTRILLSSAVIDAYKQVKTVGDSLVTDMPSKSRHEIIPGFTEAEGLKDVPEGAPYEDSGLGDKYVTSQAGKRGRIIGVTEEAIMEDRTGQLLMRAQRIGSNAAIDREKTILNGVIDKFGTVYRPSGAATALYSTANRNLMGDAGSIAGFTTPEALVDWTDIDKVEEFHSASISDDKPLGQQDPILWDPKILLVGSGKRGTAMRIRNATEIRSINGTETAIFNNPRAGSFEVVTSPFISRSGLAGVADDWLYGDFKSQFAWQNIWPIQVFSQGRNSPEAWLRDVVSQFKVRYYGGITALDHRFVVKVKGA